MSYLTKLTVSMGILSLPIMIIMLIKGRIDLMQATGFAYMGVMMLELLARYTRSTILQRLPRLINLNKKIDLPSTWSDVLAGNRTIVVMVAVAILTLSLIIHVGVTAKIDYTVLLIVALGATVAWGDLALLSWRAKRGVYGGNRAEAEELLCFISARGKNDDPDPPRRAVRAALEVHEAGYVPAADGVTER